MVSGLYKDNAMFARGFTKLQVVFYCCQDGRIGALNCRDFMRLICWRTHASKRLDFDYLQTEDECNASTRPLQQVAYQHFLPYLRRHLLQDFEFISRDRTLNSAQANTPAVTNCRPLRPYSMLSQHCQQPTGAQVRPGRPLKLSRPRSASVCEAAAQHSAKLPQLAQLSPKTT